jgi:predicted N-acetyltransferase YhbS
MQIRRYKESDFGGMQSLWEEAFPNDSPWNRAENAVPAKLAFQPDLLLVAVDESEVIGSVMAGYDGHRAGYIQLQFASRTGAAELEPLWYGKPKRRCMRSAVVR